MVPTRAYSRSPDHLLLLLQNVFLSLPLQDHLFSDLWLWLPLSPLMHLSPPLLYNLPHPEIVNS